MRSASSSRIGAPHPSALSIRNLSKAFGRSVAVPVLRNVSLEIEDRELVVLIGASGCGKTTLLRSIAGLETPSHGSIVVSGRTVFDATASVNLPPQKREVGMVFQNYALWPHLSVLENVAYPLRARRVPRRDACVQASKILATLRCEHLVERHPSQLSGGQQQRVALARSLVGSPKTVLFDEPLSNLDAQLRREVRSEIHRLQRALGFTAVYVTHDLEEGLELGTRLAVMREGVIEQIGSPSEVYRSPASAFVAKFVGIENAFACRWDRGSIQVDPGAASGAWAQLLGQGQNQPNQQVFVRASALRLSRAAALADPADGVCRVSGGVVGDVLYGGDIHTTIVDCGATQLVSKANIGVHQHEVGTAVNCEFDLRDALVFPAEVDEREANSAGPVDCR